MKGVAARGHKGGLARRITKAGVYVGAGAGRIDRKGQAILESI